MSRGATLSDASREGSETAGSPPSRPREIPLEVRSRPPTRSLSLLRPPSHSPALARRTSLVHGAGRTARARSLALTQGVERARFAQKSVNSARWPCERATPSCPRPLASTCIRRNLTSTSSPPDLRSACPLRSEARAMWLGGFSGASSTRAASTDARSSDRPRPGLVGALRGDRREARLQRHVLLHRVPRRRALCDRVRPSACLGPS